MKSIVDERPYQRPIGGLTMPDYRDTMDDWDSMYRSIFGRKISEAVAPFSRPRTLSYGIIVPGWITLELALNTLQSFQSCGIVVRNGLNAGAAGLSSLTHRRDPARHGTYIVWTSGGIYPDARLMGMRGMELTSRRIETMTLIEYLLFVLHHFVRHNWALLVDQPDPATGMAPKMLCAGSVNERGNIPLKYDDGGGFALTAAHPFPDRADPLAGSREVFANPHVFGMNSR